VLTAAVKYRFPQFNKKDMPESWYIENEERIKSINDFVEDFRGW
jgi:hypothetical protein